MIEENKWKVEEKKVEKPADIKVVKDEKAVKAPEKVLEGVAVVHGKNLAISTKHAIALCNFIRNKKPSEVLTLLENVLSHKIAVPMKGEIPHRKNMPKGKVAGRYPVNASKVFIKLVRNLIANASVKGLDVETLKISLAKANKAARPHKATRIAFGRKRFKRTHVTLEAKTFVAKTAKKVEGKAKEEKR
ncbi:MAG: uL22 family ribosomal protein [Candidatus Pacearchaeota archaeon]